MKTAIIGGLAVIFITACGQTEQAPSLPNLLDTPVIILEKNGPEIFQTWEFRDQAYWGNASTGNAPFLEDYRLALSDTLGAETLAAEVERRSRQDIPFPTETDSLDGDQLNAAYVQSGQLGEVRPINLLEAQLLNYQASRFPLFDKPTEFHAFILAGNKPKRLRVYYAASDTPWPPKATPLMEHIRQDLANGWLLQHHLHNHYNEEKDKYVGTLAPSLADAHYYKMLRDEYGVVSTLITNGFHTVEIQKEDFDFFQSH